MILGMYNNLNNYVRGVYLSTYNFLKTIQNN